MFNIYIYNLYIYAIIGRSWFKAPKQANAHNSTGYKFIQIRMQWFCEFAIPILAAAVWHLVDDISDCSSSRDTVSKYEVAPVETCPDQCLRCDMFLLIHFASGVRNKKGTAAVLYWFYSGSVEAQMVYLARVSTCPCS